MDNNEEDLGLKPEQSASPSVHTDDLKVIENDTMLGPQLLLDIDPEDYKIDSTRNVAEAFTIWKEVKSIFLDAHICKIDGQDKNAWCSHVVKPLLRLVIAIYGKEKWKYYSVQTQSINYKYLSTTTTGPLGYPKPFDRKTNYAFLYLKANSTHSRLYDKAFRKKWKLGTQLIRP
ncbi:hypothetical protein BU16DRAFT_545212 [Lophium mytilinum]|uniref:PD-(D/E)XK nuclease-like domain-containing protein n=1 Tax=Lophium mytilinum TaxID=390894 RepID=A0A6A6Q8R6_9PEZI|nr:hypothetical protein BU16DRAFT_545212 [Lophium mytilinum]